MSKENFKILKEINSLSLLKEDFQSKIASENKRIDFVESNRNLRAEQKERDLAQLKELNTQITNIENEISHLGLKLTKDKENLSTITTEAGLSNMEKQISDLESKLEAFEEEGLEKMEEAESVEIRISQADEFLAGSLDSLNEIKAEVQQTNSEHQLEIEKLEKRINLLIEELPTDFQDRYKRVSESDIKGSVFTRIKNDSCEYCRFGLSKIDIQKVEDLLQFKTCSGCRRIFIPQAAHY